MMEKSRTVVFGGTLGIIGPDYFIKTGTRKLGSPSSCQMRKAIVFYRRDKEDMMA